MGVKERAEAADAKPGHLASVLAGTASYAVKSAILLVCMVMVSTMTVVSSKRLGYAMGPYPFFILLILSFAFVPVLFLPLLYVRYRTGGFVEGHIDKALRSGQLLRHFMVIGLCNASNGVLVMNANPHTPGYMQSLLAPLIVPMTVALSAAYLGTRFHSQQLFGVLMILAGQMYQVNDQSTDDNVSLMWSIIFGASQLPMAFQAVYQEHIFSRVKVNVLFMLFWSNLFQFMLLCVLAPLAAITPGFGSTTLHGFLHEFGRAVRCMRNLSEDEPYCEEAAFWLFAVFVLMITGMILQTLTVKMTSASVAIVANTIVTPLSTFAFTSPVFMNHFAEQLPPSTWASLGLILIGLVLYRYSDVQAVDSAKPDALREKLVSSESEAQLGLPRVVSRPIILGSRVGIVDSEYSNAGHSQGGCSALIFQHTVLEEEVKAAEDCFMGVL
eukprot:TRINITY_DN32047_c0_g1_i1.p1 TRINITY_DN32047_c0_g1~~TRINITY_DN32047_c0_g1_i1.p1  ORF type:complete len:441 (+),score=86.35 TRINITY_DN32047_c0_g1_i1:137-1459(+)